MRFSERIGIVPSKQIQIESMDATLKNRLRNYIDRPILQDGELRKYIVDKLGIQTMGFQGDYSNIQRKFNNIAEWYYPYEVLEYYIEYNKSSAYITPFSLKEMYDEINQILSEEKAGYRLVDGYFVPITNETELSEIQCALHSTFDSVDTHIQKALALYSNRKQPDYENSIKESISAVESMCCIITGLTGGQATLGAALKKLEDNGVEIHGAMRSAFSQLYGYTSDQNGIRHGGIDFTNAPEEDARYMLVTCSAFVNYLKDKYAKAQSGGTT